ncbi:MAG: DUF116 domain-containing protein [Candidatus Aenigmatarchaeota archaeon]|nr:MAG: DUF116 domain-containing protein [Candidatus Aenigmarchaeota archaeon]
MKKLIQKLIATGADFSTRNALKKTLEFLGIEPDNIDKLYVELKNNLYRDIFKSLNPKDKLVFLPQCLRPPGCKAILTRDGFKCIKCENHNCKIYKIRVRAEKLGYRVFVVPGGSLVNKILERLKPKAAFGVACLKELVLAADGIKIPIQMVELLKDGCVNTDVDVKKVFDIL